MPKRWSEVLWLLALAASRPPACDGAHVTAEEGMASAVVSPLGNVGRIMRAVQSSTKPKAALQETARTDEEESSDSKKNEEVAVANASKETQSKDLRRDRDAELMDCKWGDWQPLQQCSASCGWGKLHRVRQIAQAPGPGGRPCLGEYMKEEACKYIDCPVDCSWGSWGSWTPCSKSCGSGVAERARAKAVLKQGMGIDCAGSDKDTKVCNADPCPINCEWGSWNEWSSCTKSCNEGTSARSRAVSQSPAHGGSHCQGGSEESRSCNTQNCPVMCVWGDWHAWGTCSQTCGNGTTTRVRGKAVAAAYDGKDCVGASVEHTSCNSIDCPVDCEWGLWGSWSSCSKTCGEGSRSRVRDKVVEANHGGRACSGSGTESEKCNKQACSEDCSWLSWGAWTECTKTCGAGARSRERQYVAAKFGGKPCQGSAKEDEACNTAGCPVDCQLTAWTAWQPCTATCGGGTTRRERWVMRSAAWGGALCNGSFQENSTCNSQGCAVDCAWTNWEPWSSCTKPCGSGERSRSRAKLREAAFGGRECAGSGAENASCNTEGCPVDCEWEEWSSWTLCTVTCGNGTTSRVRAQKTLRANGGKACAGHSQDVLICNTDPCPVDCVWAGWGTWTACSATCGGGLSTRSREKIQHAKHGGTDCIGQTSLEKECNTQPCPVDCRWQDWGAWSECSVTCGLGVKRRARPKMEEQNGGSPCSGLGTQEGSCSMQGPECAEPVQTSSSSSTTSRTTSTTTSSTTPGKTEGKEKKQGKETKGGNSTAKNSTAAEPGSGILSKQPGSGTSGLGLAQLVLAVACGSLVARSSAEP